MFFRIDEPVAQRNKPVCLLRKPVFRAYMLWRLYSAPKKKKKEREREMGGGRGGKKVIPAAAWIRKRESEERKKKGKAERIILTRFRTCCSLAWFL